MALSGWNLGKRIAPPRFLIFTTLIVVGTPIGVSLLGWAQGAMAAFDLAAIIFFVLIIPLFDDEANEMRRSAERNDANRAGLLAITALVSVIVLASVSSELMPQGRPKPLEIGLIVGTLILSWLFSSLIYALHYAHLFYSAEHGQDARGIEFPETKTPVLPTR